MALLKPETRVLSNRSVTNFQSVKKFVKKLIKSVGILYLEKNIYIHTYLYLHTKYVSELSRKKANKLASFRL